MQEETSAAVRQRVEAARAMHRTTRVARTLADLEGADYIDAAHVAEALSFRER